MSRRLRGRAARVRGAPGRTLTADCGAGCERWRIAAPSAPSARAYGGRVPLLVPAHFVVAGLAGRNGSVAACRDVEEQALRRHMVAGAGGLCGAVCAGSSILCHG
jgi:hypothetical protein